MTSYKRDNGKRLRTHSNIYFRGYWYIWEIKGWFRQEEIDGLQNSNYDKDCKPKSYKAFIRYVKKHSKYLPKGTEFYWISNWCGIKNISIII